VDEDTKESGGFFVWVPFHPVLDLDDECRGHGGEQTGLPVTLASCIRRVSLQTHEYQACGQVFVVFLDEVLIVFFGLFAVVLVEFGTEILLNRLRVLSLAAGGLQCGSEGTSDRTLPIGRSLVQRCISTPLVFGATIGTECPRHGVTLMRETAMRWYSSSVLTGVAHVAGTSMLPRFEIQVFREELDKFVI